MAVVFNGIDRLIEITDPAIISLDAQKDLYSAWKLWAQDGDNSKYAPAFSLNSVFGGNPTVEGQNAPRYFFLTNFWRVLVDNGNVVSVGLNLYTENYSTPYIVAAGSGISDRNSDAVSVNSEAIEYSSFNGGITIDVANLTGRAQSGTSYPIGTIINPVNNIPDLQTIAANRGFDTVYIIGNLNIDSGGAYNFERFRFVGESPTKSIITIENTANVLNCEFSQATISGVLDGNSEISHCRVSGLDFVDGKMQYSDVGPDIIKLGTSTNSNIFSCFSSIPGSSTPVIDMNGTGILGLRDYNGGIELRNYTGTGSHSIDLASGQIKLDPNTITSGTFVCRGVGKVIDASTGEALQTGTWNGGVTIVNELINLTTIGEATAYVGGVFIDVINGVSGTTDPIGLERLPVNNLADAKILSIRRGTTKLIFLSDFTFGATDVLVGYELFGTGWQNQTITFTAGCILAYSDAHDLTLTGFETGLTGISNCYIDSLGSVGLAPSSVTVVVRSSIIAGTISLPSNYSGDLVVINCHARESVSSYPTLDFGDSTSNVLISDWHGQINLINISQGNNVDIRFSQGEATLNPANVTNANIHVTGTGFLYDLTDTEILTGVWNGSVTVSNETITGSGSGGPTVWTELEKEEALAYGKKASDNAEEANLKL